MCHCGGSTDPKMLCVHSLASKCGLCKSIFASNFDMFAYAPLTVWFISAPEIEYIEVRVSRTEFLFDLVEPMFI